MQIRSKANASTVESGDTKAISVPTNRAIRLTLASPLRDPIKVVAEAEEEAVVVVETQVVAEAGAEDEETCTAPTAREPTTL